MEAMRWAKLPLGGAMAAVRAGRDMQRCTLYAGRECGRGRVQGSGDVEVGGWAAERASDGWKSAKLKRSGEKLARRQCEQDADDLGDFINPVQS